MSDITKMQIRSAFGIGSIATILFVALTCAFYGYEKPMDVIAIWIVFVFAAWDLIDTIRERRENG